MAQTRPRLPRRRSPGAGSVSPTVRQAGPGERLYLVKESSSPLAGLHGSMAQSGREAGGVLWGDDAEVEEKPGLLEGPGDT